jgi:Methane oxygenase PmoA
MPKLFLGWVAAALAIPLSAQMKPAASGVQVVANEAQRRVDITLDGAPFTSYVWPTSLKKPVLYPLIAPGGIEVSRGYPLAPREGERTDHPHHAGMWFNYGNVNNFDFWNNSGAIKPENRDKMGTIRHEKIVSVKSGKERGELVVESVWTTGDNQDILSQTTRYVFSGGKDARTIDEIVTLRALKKAVFHDDKEGLLGIRVAHFLESANEKGGTFTDASGRPTEVQANNVPGATGVYLTSEGKQGDAAWSTRGRWCILTGTTGERTVTIAMLDHPKNPNYPTYWHARGYGLFAANPLGQHIFDAKAPELDFTLDQGQSATFRYRVMFVTGAPSPAEMNKLADTFAAEYR